MAAAPLKQEEYPQYFITKHFMLAFTAPDKMYRISNVGSNSGNQGVCIDYYITRKMVLKHWKSVLAWDKVTPAEFRLRASGLFQAYINKMSNL